MKKVTVVIVTYGERQELLLQVLRRLSTFNNIHKIIIVCNDTGLGFRSDLIEVVYLGENTGSAGGYKVGLQAAYKTDCDYV